MSGGRPASPDEATIQLGRELHELVSKWDVPVDKIVERYGLARSWVYRLLSIGRTHSAPEATPQGPVDDAGAPPESPPRRVPLNSALRRMFDAKKSDRVVQLLTPDLREFWVEVVADIIQRSDDGVELPFGRQGRVYPTQARFLEAFRRPAADLEALFYDGLLVDLDGAGIAMPYGHGLRPKPRKATAAARSGSRQGGQPTDPRQGWILHAVPSGRGGVDSESTQGSVFEDSESTLRPVIVDSNVDRNGLAQAAAAAALDKANQSFSSSSFCAEAVRESSQSTPESTPNWVVVDSESTPQGDAEAGLDVSDRSAAAALAVELAAHAGIAGPPNADDRSRVRRWVALGISPDTMRAVIELKAGKASGPIGRLKYFDRAMHERHAAEQRVDAAPAPQTAPSTPAAAPLSEEDRAIAEMIEPMRAAWRLDRRGCPMAPNIETWKVALAIDVAAADLARQWVECWHVWNDRGRPSRLKPPDFNTLEQQRAAFEERMFEVLDEMTRAEAAD